MDLDHAGVVALVEGLADHVGPPVQHGENAEHPDAEIPKEAQPADLQALHRHHGADRHQEDADRPDERATGSDRPGGNRDA